MRKIRKHGKTIEKKTDRILAGGRIPDGEIRVCDVEKYYGSDTNITKAVDTVPTGTFPIYETICYISSKSPLPEV